MMVCTRWVDRADGVAADVAALGNILVRDAPRQLRKVTAVT